MLSLMIFMGYEGSNHCRKNLHNPLSLSMEPFENKWILLVSNAINTEVYLDHC